MKCFSCRRPDRMIRIDEQTDWPTLLRRLYVASGHHSQVALAVAAGLHVSRINQFLAGSNTPGRASLVRLLPALGYDLALAPRADDLEPDWRRTA